MSQIRPPSAAPGIAPNSIVHPTFTLRPAACHPSNLPLRRFFILHALLGSFALLAVFNLFLVIPTHALSVAAKPAAGHIVQSGSMGTQHSHDASSGCSPEAAQPTSPSPAQPQPQPDESDSGSESHPSTSYSNGAISATYFANWAIYGRHHFPWDIPLDSVTHVFYAFANVRPESGEVYLTDSWADEQIHWADRGDSWNDSGNNLYGCFNQFRQLKQKYRHLKLMLSIGGWSYSSNFAPGTDSSEKRQKFADSAIEILQNYGLDGLDVDWEYPNNDREADQFVDVLRKARSGLNKLKRKNKDANPYLLTIAAPCGASHYKMLHLKQMNPYLSFINLMAYDYAGSWDTISGHQANLLLTNSTVNQGNFSTTAAVDYYVSQSIPVANLVLGMPLYGRSFLNTKGIGKPFQGVGQGDWEPGLYDYKTIPAQNAKIVEDMNAVGAYTYNPSNQELITFDSPKTVRRKVKYVQERGLGGVMWWESSGDKKDSDDALIPLAAKLLGRLDSTKNHLNFPNSKWDNVKKSTYSTDSSLTSNDGYPGRYQQQTHKQHLKHHSKSTHHNAVKGSY